MAPRAGSRALRLALERALAELTRHQRDVFLLYEVEGFHHSEIAVMLARIYVQLAAHHEAQTGVPNSGT